MTRKDYVAFANAFAKLHETIEDGKGALIAFDEMVNIVADVFKEDNQRFDYERFKSAVYGIKTMR